MLLEIKICLESAITISKLIYPNPKLQSAKSDLIHISNTNVFGRRKCRYDKILENNNMK
jgi:hypothetical protein